MAIRKKEKLKLILITKKEKLAEFVAFGALLLYLLPYVLLQQDAYFDSHDSLDYYVAILTAADKSGDLWNLNPEHIVAPILGGIPRYCFHNNFDFLVILFSWLPPFFAFLTNMLLVHLVGFWGMYLLLKNHIFPRNEIFIIIIPGIALLFAILPLYPMLGITLSGLPLVLFAFMNLFKSPYRKISDYLIILFFAFYSSFVYVGVFLVIFLIGVLMVDWYVNKKINKNLFYAICLIGFAYAVFNYFLLYQVLLAKGFISHREEWIITGYNYKVAIWAAYNMLLNGHHHAQSFQTYILLIVVPLALIYGIIRRLQLNFFVTLLILSVVWAGFFGLFQWVVIVDLKEKFKWLKIFQWDRFYFFNPTLWCLIFALALGLIQSLRIKNVAFGKYFILLSLAFQVGYVIYQDEFWSKNFSALSKKFLYDTKNIDKGGSYKAYFQEEMLAEVAEYINRPKESYRVGAIGINTAVLQYNGFYTIDGYMTSYPLKYKHKFRKVIERELLKNEDMRKYFDEWGHRCYLWVAEVWEGKLEIKDLQLNTKQLKEMQCDYILSSVKITNNQEDGLKFLKTFQSPVNDLQVHLYNIQ